MPFPALSIYRSHLKAEGAFAQAQADFLTPDNAAIAELEALLAQTNTAVVAHYYMDPELQGVLMSLKHPFVHISDSLLMADQAVKMVEQGAKRVVLLGVDFMSENARAVLDHHGHQNIPLYRVRAESIGCSLAASAETAAYRAYLTQASQTPNSLHVVYINTSLLTKAEAEKLVPTITCTSSNVIKTVLSAFVQIPDGHVWFGPDTYMGHNLKRMLLSYQALDAAALEQLTPGLTPAILRGAIERFHTFEQGNCIVHHMFGAEVVDQVRSDYPNAHVAAHLEVPSEMFSLALERRAEGHGVVGSTADILSYIKSKMSQPGTHLDVVLGTEAGMITSIVRGVQEILKARAIQANTDEHEDSCRIIFPVANDAIAQTGEAQTDNSLAIVPGVMAGDGCSTEGGCATCPYMKMNSLDALMDVLKQISREDPQLVTFEPKRYLSSTAGSVAELGTKSILAMRQFGLLKRLPSDLIERVVAH